MTTNSHIFSTACRINHSASRSSWYHSCYSATIIPQLAVQFTHSLCSRPLGYQLPQPTATTEPNHLPTALRLLRTIALAAAPFGSSVMFYLAAAVSDFYVPWEDLVRAICFVPWCMQSHWYGAECNSVISSLGHLVPHAIRLVCRIPYVDARDPSSYAQTVLLFCGCRTQCFIQLHAERCLTATHTQAEHKIQSGNGNLQLNLQKVGK